MEEVSKKTNKTPFIKRCRYAVPLLFPQKEKQKRASLVHQDKQQIPPMEAKELRQSPTPSIHYRFLPNFLGSSANLMFCTHFSFREMNILSLFVVVVLYNCWCRLMVRGHLESIHRPASAACRCLCSASGGLGSLVGQTATSLGAGGVVVVPVAGLHEVHEAISVHALEGRVEKAEVADDSRGDEQNHKENEEGEVEDGVADNATLAKLCLLERVDRRADLATVETISEELDRYKKLTEHT
jgi:hypothetical protein